MEKVPPSEPDTLPYGLQEEADAEMEEEFTDFLKGFHKEIAKSRQREKSGEGETDGNPKEAADEKEIDDDDDLAETDDGDDDEASPDSGYYGEIETHEDAPPPPGERIVHAVARRLRMLEGVTLDERRKVYHDESGWVIELSCRDIPYAISFAEDFYPEGRWRVSLKCFCGWFDRWFNRRLLRYCDDLLFINLSTELATFKGFEEGEWERFAPGAKKF